jgi:hypothetical protein
MCVHHRFRQNRFQIFVLIAANWRSADLCVDAWKLFGNHSSLLAGEKKGERERERERERMREWGEGRERDKGRVRGRKGKKERERGQRSAKEL